MKINVEYILDFIKENKLFYHFIKKRNVTYKSFKSLEDIESYSIIWIKNIKDYDVNVLSKFKDLLIVTNDIPNVIDINHNYIINENPRNVYFGLLYRYKASVEIMDKKDTILQNSVINTNSIGENFKIGNFCYIDKNVKIEDDVFIEDRVSIYGDVVISKGVKIGSGTVIGREGYGYFIDTDGKTKKIPHIGKVLIGENVEIGANTVIDRGTLGETHIGNGCKINNLCHIGHNVLIKNDVFIGVGSILTGSCRIMDNVYIAPGSIIRNKITINKNAFVGLGSVVIRNVKGNIVVTGVPAKLLKKR